MRLRSAIVLFVFLAGLMTAAPAYALPSVPSSNWELTPVCAGCHADFVARWSQSMHAQALTDPVYRFKLAQADAETSGTVTPFCTTCHGPIAAMAGEFSGADMSGLSPQGAQAVSCEFCHHVTASNGTSSPIGNTSQLITTETTKHAQLPEDAYSPYHGTAYSSVFETGEFCGACHNVSHPGNGLPLEATYTEWKNSQYAADGITCQDCHMTLGAGIPVGPGRASPNLPAFSPERPRLYIMNWTGANAVFGPAEQAIAMLRSAAKVSIAAPSAGAPGGSTKVSVRIDNVGAGHYLPTGLTEVREMWLSVVAKDSAGNEILNRRRDFITVLEDADGNFPAEMWKATAIHSDDRIPPKGSAESSWTFAFPASGAVNVAANLYYRSFSPELAAAAGVTQTVPTITMASTSTVIAAATKPKPTVYTPIAPSTMLRNRYYAVTAKLKPRHTAGTYPVRIYMYRLESGVWRGHGYVRAKAANYSSYTNCSVRMRLTAKGKWRLKAYAPADGAHSAAWSSGYDSVTVR